MRAGNAARLTLQELAQTVHPRAGGERFFGGTAQGRTTGSSPRGRGTPCHRTRAWVRNSVHPRAGGERSLLATHRFFGVGSSPRGLGTLRTSSGVMACFRFIPARAGNAISETGSPNDRTVHPRAGGECQNTRPAYTPTAGSSPRGRGTPSGPRVSSAKHRFIPARAGIARNVRHTRKTTPGSSPRGRGTLLAQLAIAIRSTVHPRAGGERFFDCVPCSSFLRFIPARAGNAIPVARSARYRTVHPRAGGNAARRWPKWACSSVHPRAGGGTPRIGMGDNRLHRFIPARAGNARS